MSVFSQGSRNMFDTHNPRMAVPSRTVHHNVPNLRNIIIYAGKSPLCRKLIIAMQNCGLLALFDQVDVCRAGAKIPAVLVTFRL